MCFFPLCSCSFFTHDFTVNLFSISCFVICALLFPNAFYLICFSRYLCFIQFSRYCLVGSSGLEPPTSRLSGARSSLLSYEPSSFVLTFLLPPSGGDEEIRTLDPLLAGQVLSQLSYTPIVLPRLLCATWWAQVDSNHRPRAYQARALTT